MYKNGEEAHMDNNSEHFSPKANNSILSIIKKFVLLILLPIILSWIIYFSFINYYYAQNTFSSNESYIRTSASQLKFILKSTDSLCNSLQSSPDILNYLTSYNRKADMLYLLISSISNYKTNLLRGNSVVSSIKIYSQKTELLYSDPFYSYDEIPLSEEERQMLDETSYSDTFWVISSESSKDKYPVLYAYRRLYSYTSTGTIGYVELKINKELSDSFLAQFDSFASAQSGTTALSQRNHLIYGTVSERLKGKWGTLTIKQSGNYESFINIFKGKYEIYENYPELNATIIIAGELAGLMHFTLANPLTVLFVVIAIVIFLSTVFYHIISSLSKQIMHFSNHIMNSAPNRLKPYETNDIKLYNEIRILANSYNNLIQTNTTLVSKVNMMELLNRDARFQALQNQIRPHFLYGTLENIRMLALQNHDRQTADMIYSLASILRHTLYVKEKAVDLKDELEVVDHYIKIQQLRFGERLKYQCNIDPRLINMMIPSFLLQPLVENAVHYGASQTYDNCEISLCGFIKDDLTVFRVSNTGTLISSDRLEVVNKYLSGDISSEDFQGNGHGIALSNIKERLSYYYADQTKIYLTVTDKQTIVTISIKQEV